MRKSPESSCYVDGYAKLNLVLEVIGRRADGYHDLRGILSPVALCDRVEVFPDGGDVSVEMIPDAVSLADMCPPEDNLVVRAFRLLHRKIGLPGGVRFRIRKRIPLGGGLAGGSSDAAAALLGLNRSFGLGLSRKDLMKIGAELGSDVPAVLHGGVVFIGGRGEKVAPAFDDKSVVSQGFPVVVVNPGAHLSTAKIYGLCGGRLTNGGDSYFNMSLAVKRSDVHLAANSLYNGLQETVLEHSPEVREAYFRMKRAGALGVLVAGSGASVFGLVRDRAHGEEVCRALPPEMWSIVTTTLPDGVMVAHGPLEP